jgi:hypothetical protein
MFYRLAGGREQGGFFVDVGDHRLFKFTVGGNLWTESQYFADFAGKGDWEKLLAQAERLGLEFPEHPSERTHPQRSLEGVGAEWWDRFESFFEWAREKAQPNPT